MKNAPIWIARILLLVTVILLPWSFGGGDPLSKSVSAVLVGLTAIATLIGVVWRREAFAPVPWVVLLLLMAAIGLGVAQTIDLDEDLLQSVAGYTVSLRNDLAPESNSQEFPLLGITDPAVDEARARPTVSVFPAVTRRQVSMLAIVAIAFLVSAQLFAEQRMTTLLMTVFAVNGGLIALFGIIQQLTFNGRVYWTVHRYEGGTPFGPFMARNTGAGFLHMCLAASIPWAIVTLRRQGWGRHDESHSRGGAQSVQDWRELFSQLQSRKAIAVAAPVLIVAGILCSLSRGAALALLGAGLVALVAESRGRIRWGAALLALTLVVGGFSVLTLTGRTDAMVERFSLLIENPDEESRLALWREALSMAPHFQAAGSGMGTFGYVQPAFQQRAVRVWAWQCENVYLEALIEAGLPGLLLLLAVLAAVAWAIRGLYRTEPDSTTHFLGLAGVYLLTAESICALFDYGLRMPANGLCMAVLTGALVGCWKRHQRQQRLQKQHASLETPLPSSSLASPPATSPSPASPSPAQASAFSRPLAAPRAEGPKRTRPLRQPWLAPSMMLAAAVVGSLLAANEINAGAGADVGIDKGRLSYPERTMAIEELQTLMARAQTAVDIRPDDARLHLRMAELHLIKYRKDAAAQLERELGMKAEETRTWEFTQIILLHGRAGEFMRSGEYENLTALRNLPVVAENLRPALDHLLIARRHCPTMERVHYLLGQAGFLGAEPSNLAIHFERAVRLSPGDADQWFETGSMHFDAGRTDAAIVNWRKCLELEPDPDIEDSHLPAIVRRVRYRLSIRQIIDRVLPPSPRLLIAAAQVLQEESPTSLAERRLLADAALRMLVAPSDSQAGDELTAAERQYLAGAANIHLGRDDLAVTHLSYAVERDRRTEWCYQLAEAYMRLRRIDEARRTAKWCVWMEPGTARYIELLKSIENSIVAGGAPSSSSATSSAPGVVNTSPVRAVPAVPGASIPTSH